ncbi:hypothetical protein OAL97_05800, partial [Paracoccaceae bacterium]|nr:hypothetical protein [Paracoccaceae bacterium]
TDPSSSFEGEDKAVINSLQTASVSSPLNAFKQKLKVGAFKSAFRLAKIVADDEDHLQRLVKEIHDTHRHMNKNLLDDLSRS